ncbi:MAG: lactate racemase domain-containing protein, partial [Planctomycetaceae bacterium]|nr:lactate racemase domain-containing protein [Planctomycetaceae bacterium]
MAWFFEKQPEIARSQMERLVAHAADEAQRRICQTPKRVLLLPPDITRAHSGAGWITEFLYKHFTSLGAEVFVIPTLGQHVPHTPEQNAWMFGTVPEERILKHDWRDGCKKIGTIDADYVRRSTDGKADWEIPIEINSTVLDGNWDLIFNVGHVVPHEVLGFANHNKNYFIGLGGKNTICASHMAAACYGIENNLG